MRKVIAALSVAMAMALVSSAAYAAITGSLTTTASQKKGPKKAISAKKGKSVQLNFTGSVKGTLDAASAGSISTITKVQIVGSGGIAGYLKDAETCTTATLQTDGVEGCDDSAILAKVGLPNATVGSSISAAGNLYLVYGGGSKVILFADITKLVYNGSSIGPLKLAFENAGTNIKTTKSGFTLSIDLSAILSAAGGATTSLTGDVDLQIKGNVGTKSDSPLRVTQCPKAKKWKIQLKAGPIVVDESIKCKQTKK